MKATNRIQSISPGSAQPENARVVLLVTVDAGLVQRLIRALNGNGDLSRPDAARPYQLPLATSIAQARFSVRRVAPTVILLDERVGAPELFTGALQDLSHIAPIVFLAAPENLARLCALTALAELVTQGRVECVPRHGDFVPLATRLIERHARTRVTHRPAPAVVAPVLERAELDDEDAPLDFGEALRHEVNNPLTGILGNAELLLSRRDHLSADVVERLDVIADLAIRLRETIRRLSNALARRTARIPAQPSGELDPSHPHRPAT